jgi:hypothetical protein
LNPDPKHSLKDIDNDIFFLFFSYAFAVQPQPSSGLFFVLAGIVGWARQLG